MATTEGKGEMTVTRRDWFVLYVCPGCGWELGGVFGTAPLARTVAYPCCWKGPGHAPEVLEAVAAYGMTREEVHNLPTLVLAAIAAGDKVRSIIDANFEAVSVADAPFCEPDESFQGSRFAIVEFAPWPNRGGIKPKTAAKGAR